MSTAKKPVGKRKPSAAKPGPFPTPYAHKPRDFTLVYDGYNDMAPGDRFTIDGFQFVVATTTRTPQGVVAVITEQVEVQ